jgi:DNA-binding transcriptional regulator YhcF (GntR family)
MLEGSDLPKTTISDGAFALLYCAKLYHFNGMIAGKDYAIANKLGVDRGTLAKYLPELERIHLAHRVTMAYEGIRIPAIRFGKMSKAVEHLEGKELPMKLFKGVKGSFLSIRKSLRQLRILYSLNGQIVALNQKKRKFTDLPMIVINPRKLAAINRISKATVHRDIKDLEDQDFIRTEKINRYVKSPDLHTTWLMLKEFRKRGVSAFPKIINGKYTVRISLGTVVTALISLKDEGVYKESNFVKGQRQKLISENLWFWFQPDNQLKAYRFTDLCGK